METILPGHYVSFTRSKTRSTWKVLELSDDGKRAKLKAVNSNQIRWADLDKLKLSDLSFSWGDENIGVDPDEFAKQSVENIVDYISRVMEDVPAVKEQVTELIASKNFGEEEIVNLTELGVDKIKGDVIFTGDDGTVLIRDSYTGALYHLADIELPKIGKRKLALPIYKAKN